MSAVSKPPESPPKSTGSLRALGGALALFVVVGSGFVLGRGQAESPKIARVYLAVAAVTVADTARVDLEAVHTTLWADWVAADEDGEDERADILRRALAGDANLVDLFDQMMAAVRAGVTAHTKELLYLVWAWNTYLDRQGQPWRLSAGIQLNGPEKAVFYVKSYRVIHDSRTWVGPQSTRTRMVQRVDDLNVVEGYLGLTSDHEQGAVVVADRVSELAINRIWPLLDAGVDDERGGLDAVFAPAIRASLKTQLSPEVWTELETTAEDRFWLLAVVDAIHARASCGNTFRISKMPYDGLVDADLGVVRRFAAGTQASPCPDVTEIEAAALVIRSRQLRGRPELRDALRTLGAVVARTIAIHEARHAADDTSGDSLDCNGCPDVLEGITRFEANAYLTSFADPRTGSIALYQACGVAGQNIAGRGPSIRWLSDQLDDACTIGPPKDLAIQARDLRRSLFGSPSVVVLHDSFPDQIPVP